MGKRRVTGVGCDTRSLYSCTVQQRHSGSTAFEAGNTTSTLLTDDSQNNATQSTPLHTTLTSSSPSMPSSGTSGPKSAGRSGKGSKCTGSPAPLPASCSGQRASETKRVSVGARSLHPRRRCMQGPQCAWSECSDLLCPMVCAHNRVAKHRLHVCTHSASCSPPGHTPGRQERHPGTVSAQHESTASSTHV